MSNNNNAESNNETNFEFEDLSSLHHYRTELPNIIFEMDLDPYEFKAYCVLKKTAGDKGRCFKSIDTLCKEIGCGKTKFSEIKESLKNKNLIKILKRKHENGGNMPDLISMIDIWPLNMRTMSEKYSKKEKEKPGSEGGIPGEGGGFAKNMGGGSPKTPKEDSSSSNSSLSIKKEEEKKEEGAAAPVFSFSFFQKLNLKEEEKEKILKEHSKEKIEIAVQRCLAWKNRDSDSAAIFAILKNFDTWKDPPKHEEILDRSTKFFKTLQCYDQKTYKNNYITVGNEYIEFAAGPKIKVFNLNDKNFESDVLKHIEYLKNL